MIASDARRAVIGKASPLAISKYSRDELVGRSHRTVNSGAHSRAFMRDLWATITAGRIWHGEVLNRAKDGARAPWMYRQDDGTVGFRCQAEPINVYVSKGGDPDATTNRKCVCNALIATAGHPQVRAGKYVERGIVTSGDDLAGITRFLRRGATDCTAADVIDTRLPGVPCTQ